MLKEPERSSSRELHRVLGLFRRDEQIGLALPARAAIAEGETAGAADIEGVGAELAMRGRDHEAVLVIGDRHDAVHVLDLLSAQADAPRDRLVDDAVKRL